MRIRQAKLAALALVLVCMCTVGVGAGFEWDGGGTGNSWTTELNWSIGFCPPTDCYPKSCNDDATFPASLPTWDVDLVTLTIDDLRIFDNVDFAGASAPTLTVDSLKIVGETVVTIVNATIKTANCL